MTDLITVSGVKEYLEGTRFECSDALPLSGGTANFIFRISLLRPVEGHSSLILKHGRPFVGNIPFSLKRQAYEVEALKWISTWIAPNSPVKVPAVLLFDEDKAVIIMEDVGPDAKTLKQLLLDGAVSEATAKKVGNALGEFIANVHRRSGGEGELLRVFDANEQGKSISAWATYGRLVSTLQGEDMPVLSDPPMNLSEETINTIATLSKERSFQINASANCLVMGDFWPGNIVLSPTAESIYVIDWELAKTGLEGLDLGQFCAEIHTLRRFHQSQSTSADAIISAFFQTHRRLRDHPDPLSLAGTVVTHVGAHLVAWTPRVEWGGREDTRAVVAEGVELLVGGYSGSHHQTQSWHDFLKASLAVYNANTGGPDTNPLVYTASMSDRKVIFTEEANPPLPIYSQAIVSNGTVYASGNIGCDRELKLVEGGVQGQTRAALKNLAIVLKASGSGLEHILKVNIYLTDLPKDFAAMNEVYAEFFQDKPPARTCIGVAALPLGAEVEIECVAAVAK